MTGNSLTELPEEFRVLKNHLISRQDRPLKTIMVTSAVHGEGVSMLVRQLATAFAEDGQKVLLIDAHYRTKAGTGSLFSAGMLISGSININGETLDVSCASGMSNFSVMSHDCWLNGNGGKAADWLSNTKKLLSLIPRIKESFDMIFIDTAPVLKHSESLMIASQTDGVILTVHADQTKRQLVIKAREELSKANANIVGVVLNRKKHIIPHFFYK